MFRRSSSPAAAASYDLLVRAMREPLPLPLVHGGEVDAARNYVAAGLVVADLPSSDRATLARGEAVAPRILAVTPAGRSTVIQLTKSRRRR